MWVCLCGSGEGTVKAETDYVPKWLCKLYKVTTSLISCVLAVLREDGCGNRWPSFLVNLSQGKLDKYAYLHVRAYLDNYVYFESAENQGCYVGFNSQGNPCQPKKVAASEDDAKFFVRVEVSAHHAHRRTV